jgi:hypothetical protein
VIQLSAEVAWRTTHLEDKEKRERESENKESYGKCFQMIRQSENVRKIRFQLEILFLFAISPF